ncbi:MAG: preprotein translocase subunit SecE [bacterium]
MFEKVSAFFKDVKAELKKVVFPNKDELIGSTQVVIITVLIISFFLGIVDLVLAKFIKYILR